MTSRDGPILLVEDNADDEALVMMALRKNGVPNKVIVAHDGQEALDFLEQGRLPEPALVLLDLKTPRMNGLEFLAAVRARPGWRGVPVVVLTSSLEPRDLREAYRLGANSYLRKPVDFDAFARLVGLFAEYWLQWNEAPVADASEVVT